MSDNNRINHLIDPIETLECYIGTILPSYHHSLIMLSYAILNHVKHYIVLTYLMRNHLTKFQFLRQLLLIRGAGMLRW